MATKTKFKPGIATNDFTLFAGKVQAAVDDFSRRLNQYVIDRVDAGDDRAAVLAQVDADFKSRGPLYRKLGGEVGAAVDFGANRTFQRRSNPKPANPAALFKWTLDPDAEHCDSCLHQAAQPARPFDEIPLPTQQPTHGESNCGEYCKCTLTPTRNAGGQGRNNKATPSTPTPAPSAPKKPRAPKPPATTTDTGLKPPKPTEIENDWFAQYQGKELPPQLDWAKVPDASVDAARAGLDKSAGAYGAKVGNFSLHREHGANGHYIPDGAGHKTGNGGAGTIRLNADYMRDADAVIKKVKINFDAKKSYMLGDLENDLQIATARGDAVRATRLQNDIKNLNDTKRWSISSDAPTGLEGIARTATHEGFHAVYFQTPGMPAAWRAALKRNGCDDAWVVSEYAASAEYETFTEVGAAIAHGVDIPEKFRKAFFETLAKFNL